VNQVVAIGDCWLCGRTFLFDADAVPSIWVDSATMLSTPDDWILPETAVREPVWLPVCPGGHDGAARPRRHRPARRALGPPVVISRGWIVGVALAVVAGIGLDRAFLIHRLRRRQARDHATRAELLAEMPVRSVPPVRGVVIDAGGGQVGIMVERDVEGYPAVGTPVALVETGPSVLEDRPDP